MRGDGLIARHSCQRSGAGKPGNGSCGKLSQRCLQYRHLAWRHAAFVGRWSEESVHRVVYLKLSWSFASSSEPGQSLSYGIETSGSSGVLFSCLLYTSDAADDLT